VRRALWTCATIGALIAPPWTSPARGDEEAPGGPAAASGLTVRASGCSRLDEREVTRLLGIELGPGLARDGRELRVEITCDGSRLRITAIDSITEKRLEREVHLGPEQLQGDRVVAILASQLFLTSWSELLLPAQHGATPQGPPEPATADARRLAETRAREAFAPRGGVRWDVQIAGGVRVRELGSPLLVGRGAIRAGVIAGPAEIFLDVGGERGAATRASGTVAASFADLAAGVSWRPLERGPFTLDIEAAGGVSWIELRGADPASGVEARSVSGIVGEGSIGVVPGLRLGSLRLGLSLQGGLTFSRARASVAGDDAVSLAGPWVGAGLTLGVAERER
jgi:hypothetical protein